jgi:bacterioferritin-associated ferredoxin
MYVCICKGITDTQIREEIIGGAVNLKSLMQKLGVGSQCAKCVQHTVGIIKETSLQNQIACVSAQTLLIKTPPVQTQASQPLARTA